MAVARTDSHSTPSAPEITEQVTAGGSWSWLRWQSRLSDWQRVEQLLTDVRRPRLPYPDRLRTLAELPGAYRRLLHDLALSRTAPEFQDVTRYLNVLAAQAYQVLYQSPAATWWDLWRFVARDFPRMFRKYSGYILLGSAFFFAGSALGYFTVVLHPETADYFMPAQAIADLARGKLWMEGDQPALYQASMLMANNIRVMLNCFVGGMLLGVGSLLMLFYNGVAGVGGPLGVTQLYNLHPKLLAFMLPHGPLELTTIFISGGMGLSLTVSFLFPKEGTRMQSLRKRGRDALILVLGCVPLLVIAGLVEGMISLDNTLSVPLRMSIGAVTFLLLILYIALAGRGEDKD